MSIDIDKKKVFGMFPDETILIAYRGSIAHNMYIPNTDPNSTDDIDLMGVFMPPVDEYIGLDVSKGTIVLFEGKYDTIRYEFRKFIRLLLRNNPTVLSLLHLKPEHYLYINPYAQLIIDNKELFSSKRVYETFTGYARRQLLRMERHKFEGYMGSKRKLLVEKYGYDTRMASHCVRLLKTGIELLKTGKLNVAREHDAQNLLAIKKGEYSLAAIKMRASDLFFQASKAFTRTDLPDEPDYKAINKLTKHIIYRYIKDNYDGRI